MKNEKTGGETCRSAGIVSNDAANRMISIGDGNGQLMLKLDYGGKCVVREAWVKGRQVLSAHGAYTAVKTADGIWYTTQDCAADPVVRIYGNSAEIGFIGYGGGEIKVTETWTFTADEGSVFWKIRRSYSAGGVLSDTYFPAWNFQGIDTWTGAVLDNGGVAWMKLLDRDGRTLGTHSGTVTFWDRIGNDCLRIVPLPGKGMYAADCFRKRSDGEVIFCNEIALEAMKPKYDLQNFRNAGDVWKNFHVDPGIVSVTYRISALDYDRTFDRGVFAGLDGSAIREMSNTIARYGVIDNGHAGLNGWMSGYVCLHEPFLGKVAAAVGCPDYTGAVRDSLDFYRDHAVQENGRVLPRFQYMPGDEEKGTRTDSGFYEAQWGTLLDSQTGYVIMAADLFHLNGDIAWIGSQKATCEKALDYLLARGNDRNGLVKMANGNTKEKRSSDWIDIVWAANENALVNAELYGALGLWADIEEILEDGGRADFYRAKASALKDSFNRSVAQGGFWDPDHCQYIYWRDEDGTIHGTNLVIPVQFAAIGYGVCDDPTRINSILSGIEAQMVKEGLFSWPLCMSPFTAEETVTAFPGYENGDIFLSWNELGLRSYVKYDPAIAVKYVKNIIDKYNSDGLAAQRYLRKSQTGAGDDILAGNYMTIAGLYGSIYGIHPFYNRLYLEPHITSDLNGTALKYPLRGQTYMIDLIASSRYRITVSGFAVSSEEPFAVNLDRPDQISYFVGDNNEKAVTLARSNRSFLNVDMADYSDDGEWTETSGGDMTVSHTVSRRIPNRNYRVYRNGVPFKTLPSDRSGILSFEAPLEAETRYRFGLAAEDPGESAAGLTDGSAG